PSVLEMLPRLAWHYDEPFADSSAIPTMYLSEVTRRSVKVALTGDGGDELFAGYQRYMAARWAAFWQRLPMWSRRLLAVVGRVGRRAPSRSFLRRVYRFTQAFPLSVPERYLRWVGVCERPMRRELLLPDVVRELPEDAEAVLLQWAKRCGCPADAVTQAMCVDWHTYLPGDILCKVDIASMAHGLECRSPFLDHHVAELAALMPLRLKQSWRRGKKILIQTFRELLPPEIQTRGKMGFGVPLADWFREALRDWLRDVLLASDSGLRNWFDTAAIRRLIDEHQSGQLDHAPRLWALVAFDAWYRTHVARRPVPVESSGG
ncbi:MAG: asparagine synthetase B, partial [Planctomycetota bacterium]